MAQVWFAIYPSMYTVKYNISRTCHVCRVTAACKPHTSHAPNSPAIPMLFLW